MGTEESDRRIGEGVGEILHVLNVDIHYLIDWENKDEDAQCIPIREDKKDLICTYRPLNWKERLELLGKAYELERINKNDRR